MEWMGALNEAINYMEQHLMEKITADDVAAHVAVSSYYLQRTFQILTDCSISDYIKNRRLSLAGEELAQGDVKVIDVAYRYGYETPESFSKAFLRFHGITPVRAKTQQYLLKKFHPFIIQLNIKGGDQLLFRIETKPGLHLIARHREFSYETGYHEIPKFWEEESMGAGAQNPVLCGMFGISREKQPGEPSFDYYIADPVETLQNGCKNIDPAKYESVHIPELTWAVFPCIGPMPYAFQNLNTRIFSEWIPGNREYKVSRGLYVESYSMGNPRAAGYQSEIWIPVEKI